MTYLRRLEVGLFTLQLIDYIILEVCHSGIPSASGRVHTILGQRGVSLVGVAQTVREYLDGLGEEDREEREEKERLEMLLKQFE